MNFLVVSSSMVIGGISVDLSGWVAALCWNFFVPKAKEEGPNRERERERERAERGKRGTKGKKDWDTFWHETIPFKNKRKKEEEEEEEEEYLNFYGLLATFLCVELPVTTMTLCPPTFLYSSTHPPGGWPSNTWFLFVSFVLFFFILFFFCCCCCLFSVHSRRSPPHPQYGAECTV